MIKKSGIPLYHEISIFHKTLGLVKVILSTILSVDIINSHTSAPQSVREQARHLVDVLCTYYIAH